VAILTVGAADLCGMAIH